MFEVKAGALKIEITEGVTPFKRGRKGHLLSVRIRQSWDVTGATYRIWVLGEEIYPIHGGFHGHDVPEVMRDVCKTLKARGL